MFGLVWGKSQQLCFADDHEYYRALGSLCRHDSYTITFETNSETESWGDAFRIKCLESDDRIPDAFYNAMRTARRINCNDYVQNLYEFHHFDFDVANKVLVGDYNRVKETVPSKYHFDFDEGYRLRFTHYERKKAVKSTVPKPQPIVKQNHKKDVTADRIVSVSKPLAPPKLPLPEPIHVDVGETLTHKVWGKGTVIESGGKYLVVHFSSVGDKRFTNPDAFEKRFLSKE